MSLLINYQLKSNPRLFFTRISSIYFCGKASVAAYKNGINFKFIWKTIFKNLFKWLLNVPLNTL